MSLQRWVKININLNPKPIESSLTLSLSLRHFHEHLVWSDQCCKATKENKRKGGFLSTQRRSWISITKSEKISFLDPKKLRQARASLKLLTWVCSLITWFLQNTSLRTSLTHTHTPIQKTMWSEVSLLRPTQRELKGK